MHMRTAACTLISGLALVVAGCGMTSPAGTARSEDPPAEERIEIGPLVADAPGDLADAADGVIAGVDVGPGVRVETRAPGLDFWISDNDLDAETWTALVAAFPETGLWPVGLRYLGLGGDGGRPWRSDQDVFFPEPVSDEDVLELLSAWSPLGPLEQLAPGRIAGATPMPRPFGLDIEDGPIALVPVTRPADVVARLGWIVGANYGHSAPTTSALLRSWEDRFGVYVTAIGFDELYLTASRPPQDLVSAQLLALEHYAWCPTLLEFDVPIDEYAVSLVGADDWYCWWD